MGANEESGLNFTAKLSTEEAKKSIAELQKMLSHLKTESDVTRVSFAAVMQSNGATNNFAEANVKMTKAIRDSILVTERLRVENANIQNEFLKGSISLQELNVKQKANTLARKETTMAIREARKAQEETNESYLVAESRLKVLNAEIKLNALGRNTPEFKSKVAESNELGTSLKSFDAEMGGQKKGVGGVFKSALSGAGAQLLKMGGGFLQAYASLDSIIESNVEISDSLAEMSINAGLTKNEVGLLLETLKGFDTRTSLKGLLDISKIGGQLGIPKEDIAEFTKTIDQLSFALAGEIPGGAEAVASALGKLNKAFNTQGKEGTSLEESYNRTASAILKLGQGGEVTGTYLQNFGLTVSRAAENANISLPTILAYGAVLERTGVSADIAGSSMNGLLKSLTSKQDDFYAIAKMADSKLTLEEFSKLINTDANEALQLFFKGLNEGGNSSEQFAKHLDSITSKTGVSKESILALAQNQRLLNDEINSTVTAYGESSFATDQAKIKNNNLAGSIEKLKNTIVNLTTNPDSNLGLFFGFIVDSVTDGIKALEGFIDKVKRVQYDIAIGIFNKTKGKQTGNMFISTKDVEEEIKRREKLQDKLKKEEISGRGFSTADRLAGGKSELELKKLLIGETYKLGEQRKRLNNIPKDAKEKRGELSDHLIQQEALVKGLNNNYNRLYPKPPAPSPSLSSSSKSNSSTGPNLKEEVKSRNELQKEIDSLIDGSSRKQKTADEIEIAEIGEKYKKIRDKVKEHYDHINERFKNPKDRDQYNVRSSGLDDAEKKEKQEAEHRASNERFKTQLTEQTKNFETIEDYRQKYGEEATEKRYKKEFNLSDERYKNEFSSAEAYAQKLEQVKTEIQNKYGDPSSYSESQKQELSIVTNQIIAFNDKRKSIEEATFASAFQAAKTFKDKERDIENEFQSYKEALAKKGELNPDRLANLEKQKADKKKALNEEIAFEKSGYAELMENYDAMTRQKILKELNAQKEINNNAYKKGDITAKQLADRNNPINGQIDKLNENNIFNKISESIKRYKEAKTTFQKSGGDAMNVTNAQKQMYTTIAEGAEAASVAVSGLSDVFGQLGIGGEDLQKTMKDVAGVISGAGQLAKGIATDDPVAIVSGSIKLLTSAINLFNTKDKKLQKQIDGYKAQLTDLGRAYTQLERDVNNAVGDDYYTKSQEEIENLLKQQDLLTKSRDAERDKKKSDQGKVDDYQNQIEAIPGKIEDIKKARAEMLVQTNFKDLSNSLADAFTEAFKSGEDAAGKFDDVFNNVIVNAVKNSAKLKLIQPIVNKMLKEMADYAENHDNSVLGYDFEKWRDPLKNVGKQFDDTLEGIKNYLPKTNGADADALKSTALTASLNQPTAERLEGLWRGQFDLTMQINTNTAISASNLGNLYMVATSNLNTAIKIEANTFRTANNTDGIADKLDQIINNTKVDKSTRD